MKNTKTSTKTKQSKKIGIFSITGKRKRTFTRQIDAAKFLGCTQENIHYALNGKVKTCKGYVVRWCDSLSKEVEPDTDTTPIHSLKKTAHKTMETTTKTQIKKTVKKCAKKIAIFNVRTGKKSRVFQNAAEVARFLGVNPSNVCRTLSGKHSSCKNYTMKYV